jgi:hypothetical protein
MSGSDWLPWGIHRGVQGMKKVRHVRSKSERRRAETAPEPAPESTPGYACAGG